MHSLYLFVLPKAENYFLESYSQASSRRFQPLGPGRPRWPRSKRTAVAAGWKVMAIKVASPTNPIPLTSQTPL
jgi:hypothetical protein